MERIREGDKTRPKRLPSRRWAITHGNNATNRFEDEDDDEYEAETLMSVIHSFSERACSRNHEYNSSFS
jgi:hypothetical protein